MSEKQNTEIFNEIWQNWDLKIPKGQYNIESFEFIEEVFTVAVKNISTLERIEIFFNIETVFRVVKETHRTKLYENISNKYGNNFYKEWSFFKINNSEYLEWLYPHNYKTSNDFELKHFIILGKNYILDIATAYEPEVEISEGNNNE